MNSTFKGSLYTLAAMFIFSAFCIGVGVATREETLINNLAMGGFVTMLCSSPLVILIAIVSGFATLVESFTDNQKRKRQFDDFMIDTDDVRLDEIMKQLTPQQQVYLENRLRNARLGVGTDGELMSMDDLLNEFEDKEKRM